MSVECNFTFQTFLKKNSFGPFQKRVLVHALVGVSIHVVYLRPFLKRCDFCDLPLLSFEKERFFTVDPFGMRSKTILVEFSPLQIYSFQMKIFVMVRFVIQYQSWTFFCYFQNIATDGLDVAYENQSFKRVKIAQMKYGGSKQVFCGESGSLINVQGQHKILST